MAVSSGCIPWLLLGVSIPKVWNPVRTKTRLLAVVGANKQYCMCGYIVNSQTISYEKRTDYT